VLAPLGCLLLLVLMAGSPGTAQSAEVVVEIRFHGNVVTPDEELLRLAGIEVGTRNASSASKSASDSPRSPIPRRSFSSSSLTKDR